MRLLRRLSAAGLFAALTAMTVQSQPPAAPATTPASAAVPATYRSFIVFDGRLPQDDPRNRQDKIHCLVCENGLAPVVAIFARSVPADANAPLAKLMKALQPLIPKYRGDRFASYVVFLRVSDEPDPSTGKVDSTKEVVVKKPDNSEVKEKVDKEFPDDARTKLEGKNVTFAREKEIEAIRGADPKTLGGFALAVETPQIPIGLASEKSKANETFGISEDEDAITVILYNRLFIAKKWTFKPDELTDEKIKEIVTAAEDTITGLSK